MHLNTMYIENEIYSIYVTSEIYSVDTTELKFIIQEIKCAGTDALKYVENETCSEFTGEFGQTEYGPGDFVNLSIIMQKIKKTF
jgi:hypothetical protein